MLFPVLNCTSVPPAGNDSSLLWHDGVTLGSVASYECSKAKTFSNGDIIQNISCVLSKHDKSLALWDLEPGLCYGKADQYVFCDIPHPAEGTDITMTGRDPGDVAIYQCHYGRAFPDGSTKRSIVCLESGKWSTVAPKCPGQ